MKNGRKTSVIVDHHGKFACEEPDLDLEFGFPVCPECFSADISCDSVVCEESKEHFFEIFEVGVRYRRCLCEDCGCGFRQIGRKKYHFKPLNLIFLASLLAMVAGLILPFVFEEGSFVLIFVVGLVVFCGYFLRG